MLSLTLLEMSASLAANLHKLCKMAALRHPFAGRYSSREIARHCGVSHMTIERARDAICNIVTDERIVTRGNGQQYTMNTANIGKQVQLEWT